MKSRWLIAASALCLGACGAAARLPLSAGTGAHPELPPPDHALIALVNVVTARGWSNGATPVAAEGTAVNPFASGLEHPRWLYVLPNGDVLVAETSGMEPSSGSTAPGTASPVADTKSFSCRFQPASRRERPWVC